MTATVGWLARASIAATIVVVAPSVSAQPPVQFRAELHVRDLDGKAGTGKLYAGGAARLRMEFTAFGETRPTITDAASGNQYTLSPGKKTYMEMPLGESGGPVRIPRIGPVDPANPCGSGELSDCEALGAETLNGIDTRKWRYTNMDGERVTAWISARLRFPVRTTADSGATTELRNVVEGPQPAALFQVPSGYARVDDIGGSGDDIADAMAGMDPAMVEQAMATARQMHATNQANPDLPARAAVWEAGPGYVINYTITMRATKEHRGDMRSSRSNLSMRYSASVPMNYGTPAVPPSVGPQWSLFPKPGSGSRQAEALPVTMKMEWQEQIERHVDTGGCTGIEYERSDTSITVTGKASSTALITQPLTQGYAQAMLKIDGMLTTYDLGGGVSSKSKAAVVTKTRRVDRCAGNRVTEKTENTAPLADDFGAPSLSVRGVPLPPTTAGLKGKRTIEVRFAGYSGPAEAEWHIAPITTR